MKAFTAAVDMGAEMIEFDVRRTADNVLVIHHNSDFAGSEIRDMSRSQLQERAGAAGYTIPTLVDVLEFCASKIPVDIELKEPGYEEHVLETVLGVLEQDQFVISSFHDSIIRKVKNLHSGIRTGLNIGDRPRRQLLSNLFPGRRVRRTGADILVISQKLLKLGFLSTTRGLGLPIWVYTVNDRQDLWKMITEERVDGIFSDRVDVGLFLRDLHTVGQNPESRIQNPE
jgi:glycerophosphoryl diester phosphodiesterase